MDLPYTSHLVRCRNVKPSTVLILLLSVLSFLFIYMISVSYIQTTTIPSPFFLPRKLSQLPSSLFSSSSSFSSSSLSSSPSQLPHRHIYYLKTHKTGSTTIFFILAEFCRSHDLLPLLPNGKNVHINLGPPLSADQVFLVRGIKKYDMVFNHHIFDPSIFTYLHRDTFTFTTLREPFDNFVSAFLYYRTKWHVPYLNYVGNDDPVTEFLRDPFKHKPRLIYQSYTNNRQSVDLGYNVSNGFNNTGYIKRFIKQTETRFNLVLITEYFDESLVILKRALGWKTEDIVYLSKNKGMYYGDNIIKPEKEALQRKLHAKFSKADIMLYDHFLKKFKERMKEEVGLQEEVAEFRKMLQKLRKFCSFFNESIASSMLVIQPGRWTNGFYMSPYKCKWLGLQESHVTKHLKERLRTMFLT